ncbi:hypothetical protein FJTKL_08452 [Diaporthe vaccinii]|uniref:Uncharacterized protein n=1 Tax=Diaporthe vaccinii TaxID=105482 RepID=A0ABR4ES34_9PEZI
MPLPLALPSRDAISRLVVATSPSPHAITRRQSMDHSSHLVSLVRPQGIRKLLQRAPDELRLLPQVGRQESVGVGDSGEGGLQGVLERLGRASGRCVGVLDTSELEETLDSWGGDKRGTAGRGDKLQEWSSTYTDGDGAALSRLLDGDGVGLTKVGTPVSSSHGDDAQLGDDDGGTDGGGDLLGGLDAEANVTLGVTDDDNGLESGTLTGTGLLLDGLDLQEGEVDGTYLHDLVLELGQEEVDDLVLLDGQRVQVDLLHALDLASLYETAQLGDGLPLLLLALAAATSTATAASTSTIAATTVAESTTTGTASVSHGLK